MSKRYLSPFSIVFGLIALLLFIQFSYVSASAAPPAGGLVVTRLDDPTPDGCQAADCSLREAIIAANAVNDNNMITFAVTGTVELSIAGADEDSAATGDLDIRYTLVLQGNGIANTIVDGNGLDRVFDVNQLPTSTNPDTLGGFSVELRDLTITGGNVTVGTGELGGGGIRAQGGAFSLIDSDIRNNTVVGGNGGGLALNLLGGGIARTSVMSNSAANGGAVFGTNSVINITMSTISQNSATSGTVAGVYHLGSVDGIHHLNFDSSTIADNAGSGFGIQVLNLSAARSNFRNTVVANNSGIQCATISGSGSYEFTSTGYNLTSDSSCGFNHAADLRNTDPLLGTLLFNHYEAASNSPILDTGSSTHAIDQLGQPRPVDLPGIPNTVDGKDRGAIEAQGVPTAVTVSRFEPMTAVSPLPALMLLGVAVWVGWRMRHFIR